MLSGMPRAPKASSSGARDVCLFRYHSPLNRVNWGGRATSLALAGIVESTGRRVTQTIGAQHIINQVSKLDRILDYSKVDEFADVIVRGGDLDNEHTSGLRRQLESVDELIVNGEGDFILTERLTLFRTLGVMRAAQLMGKPVHLLNTMLSYGHPELRNDETEAAAIAAIGGVLPGCASIMYRDPGSLALHQEMFPDLAATWQPDALFSWADQARTSLADRRAFDIFNEGVPLDVQRLLESDRPYVILSGSSLDVPEEAPTMTARVAELVEGLHARCLATVFVRSADPDDAWRKFLPPLEFEITSVKIPLAAAARLLWNSSVMISGRYHPSILASLGGTPFALMASNSHKTQTLGEVIPFPVRIPELPFFHELESVEPLLGFVDNAIAGGKRLRRGIRKQAASNGERVSAAIRSVLA